MELQKFSEHQKLVQNTVKYCHKLSTRFLLLPGVASTCQSGCQYISVELQETVQDTKVTEKRRNSRNSNVETGSKR